MDWKAACNLRARISVWGMRELRQQLTNALLMIVTVAAVVAAAINFQQQSKFYMPDDGATWVDQIVAGEMSPVASYIAPGSAAEKLLSPC